MRLGPLIAILLWLLAPALLLVGCTPDPATRLTSLLEREDPDALADLLAFTAATDFSRLDPALRRQALAHACTLATRSGRLTPAADACWSLFDSLQADPMPTVGEGRYSELLMALGEHWLSSGNLERADKCCLWLELLFDRMSREGLAVGERQRALSDFLRSRVLSARGKGSQAVEAMVLAQKRAMSVAQEAPDLLVRVAEDYGLLLIAQGDLLQARMQTEDALRQARTRLPDRVAPLARLSMVLSRIDQENGQPLEAAKRLEQARLACGEQPQPEALQREGQALREACRNLWVMEDLLARGRGDKARMATTQRAMELWSAPPPRENPPAHGR